MDSTCAHWLDTLSSHQAALRRHFFLTLLETVAYRQQNFASDIVHSQSSYGSVQK
jgi:hypothetical protein